MPSFSSTPTKSNSSCCTHVWFSGHPLGPGPTASSPKRPSDYLSLATIKGRTHFESFYVTNAKLSTIVKATVIIELLLQALKTFWRDQREKWMKPILYDRTDKIDIYKSTLRSSSLSPSTRYHHSIATYRIPSVCHFLKARLWKAGYPLTNRLHAKDLLYINLGGQQLQPRVREHPRVANGCRAVFRKIFLL